VNLALWLTHDNYASIIENRIKELEKKANEPENRKINSKKNFTWIFLVVVLIGILISQSIIYSGKTSDSNVESNILRQDVMNVEKEKNALSDKIRLLEDENRRMNLELENLDEYVQEDVHGPRDRVSEE
jgi:hypothetical protein